MKKILYIKFLLAYLAFAVLGFIVISTYGSKKIEEQLINDTSRALYQEAYSLTDWQLVKQYRITTSQPTLYQKLKAVAAAQDASIMVIAPDGEIVINTADSFQSSDHEMLADFDPADFGPGYYETGYFFNYFDGEQISVLLPIAVNMNIRGYLVVHTPMSSLIAQREVLLRNILEIFGLIFTLSLGIMILFTFSIYFPLLKIIEGAKEYAMGNLKYKIKVDKSDEIGYLASTMNYMGDELLKNHEYQNQFIANVSHDFRSPLTSIKGYAEAMSDGTIPPELYPKYLGIIKSESERLDKLTRSMLTLNDMNKKMVLHMTDFDINAVIKNTVAVFEGICRQKRISIDLYLEDEDLYVYADVDKIQQVLYNLLDNAIKFSNKSSTITLETTDRHGKIYVSVKDTGEGIPKDAQNKIFDRFYKIDSSRGKDRKGTGLGLAIVKEIIQAHEQNINVISTEGVGTEFIFTLNHSKLV